MSHAPTPPVPPAAGVRLRWPQLPESVRAAVARILGSPVVEADSQAGGFSPGTADRVVTAAGRRAFVKAVSGRLNAHSLRLHRTEARVAAALPPTVPAPRLLGSHDDSDWIALVFEDVAGRPPALPWVEEELRAVLHALRQLAQPVTGLRPARETLARDLDGWALVRADPPLGLDPWARENLEGLVDLADRGKAALAGEHLVHLDLRADNLLLRADGTVCVVDWPYASMGPPWVDTLCLLLNVRLHGGPADDSPLDHFRPDPRDVTAVLAGLGGFFTHHARLAPPPGLPTLRAFQQAQADLILPWLRVRLEGEGFPPAARS